MGSEVLHDLKAIERTMLIGPIIEP